MLRRTEPHRAVGIILSGYDGDGTDRCNRIKANGGTTFAQDRSAEVNEMPATAQQAGCIALILAIDEMPSELQRLVRTAVARQAAPRAARRDRRG